MIRTDVLIVGGGLAGLSTAFHLNKLSPNADCLIVEKNDHVGGRAASVKKNGFTFDHTGHLLHLHDPYAKKMILGLLRGNVALHARANSIFSHGVFTRYPFQANTFGLPLKALADCVGGFAENLYRRPVLSRHPSFEEWTRKTFGDGISDRFMIPYNQKLWRTKLSDMTTDWQGRFLPRPKAEEVLYGALADQKKFFGYNSFFRYPVRGGCQALPDALAARVGGVNLGCRVRSIDLREKVADVEGLGEVRYERLVNTMPLVDLLDIVTPLPADVRAARRKLRYVSVHNLNIGIRRSNISKQHWVYFPEKKFVFYRAGFTSNFSKHLMPRGTTSMYIEVSRDPGQKVNRSVLERQCLEGLRSCGILKKSDKLDARVWIPIECAYVVYDKNRTPALNKISPYLKKRGVASIGRWGGWKYSFMEETILDGLRCAEELLGRRRKRDSSSSDLPLTALK
jgi:protoporphyrinogen oxidase